jgi:hypothetical protein
MASITPFKACRTSRPLGRCWFGVSHRPSSFRQTEVDQLEVCLSKGRLKITSRFYLEPNVSVSWVDFAEGSYRLSGSRITYTMTSLMFVSTLIQYNSH